MSEFTETSKKNNGPYIAIILLLLLGLAVMGFMWSRKNSQLNACTVENTQLNADMAGMNEMMQGYVGNMSNDLKTDFKNMLKTYDALIEKDKSKADSLNAQKAKIQDLIDQLDQNKKMTASQLYKMRKENETLRTIMKGYVRQIDSLNTMNLKLTSVLDETTTKLNATTIERDDYM
jgi:chromosome segregation ATPase